MHVHRMVFADMEQFTDHHEDRIDGGAGFTNHMHFGRIIILTYDVNMKLGEQTADKVRGKPSLGCIVSGIVEKINDRLTISG